MIAVLALLALKRPPQPRLRVAWTQSGAYLTGAITNISSKPIKIYDVIVEGGGAKALPHFSKASSYKAFFTAPVPPNADLTRRTIAQGRARIGITLPPNWKSDAWYVGVWSPVPPHVKFLDEKGKVISAENVKAKSRSFNQT